jgi:hypothetical protein
MMLEFDGKRVVISFALKWNWGLGVVIHAYNLEAEVEGFWFEASPIKVSMRPFLKNKSRARNWAYTSSDRALPGKVLSSVPSPSESNGFFL